MLKVRLKNEYKKLCHAVIAGICFSGALLTLPLQAAELGEPEKEELKFGFIKLTDMAPIAIAYENGYFEDEGLYVTIEAQANWKVLLNGVIDGSLDGAHMLAGQPIAPQAADATETATTQR